METCSISLVFPSVGRNGLLSMTRVAQSHRIEILHATVAIQMEPRNVPCRQNGATTQHLTALHVTIVSKLRALHLDAQLYSIMLRE
jgi:hypothetical protein